MYACVRGRFAHMYVFTCMSCVRVCLYVKEVPLVSVSVKSSKNSLLYLLCRCYYCLSPLVPRFRVLDSFLSRCSFPSSFHLLCFPSFPRSWTQRSQTRCRPRTSSTVLGTLPRPLTVGQGRDLSVVSKSQGVYGGSWRWERESPEFKMGVKDRVA